MTDVRTEALPHESRETYLGEALPGSPVEMLSPAHREMLDLISRGLSTQALAKQGGLTYRDTFRQQVFITKSMGARALPHAVAMACEAHAFPEPSVLEDGRPKDVPPYLLPQLDFAIRGMSVLKIARTTYLTEGGVKSARYRLRQALGAHTMCHAVRIAYEAGIWPDSTARDIASS